MADINFCGTPRVFLISGQSNAVGAAGNMGNVLPGTYPSQRYEGYLNPVNQLKVLYSERIVNANDPITIVRDIPLSDVVQPYPDSPYEGRHGVELSLARYLKNVRPSHWSPNDQIVLLKFAAGGVSIGRFLETDTTGFHAAFDEYLRDSVAEILALCPEATFEKMFWLQGEANATNGSAEYLSRFQEFLTYVNTIADFDPVYANLKERLDGVAIPGTQFINQEMCANYPCTGSSEDLEFIPEGLQLHYTADSYMRLGLRLGRAYSLG